MDEETIREIRDEIHGDRTLPDRWKLYFIQKLNRIREDSD